MRTKFFTLFLALVESVGTMFAGWDYKRVPIGDLYYYLDNANNIAQVTSQDDGYPYWSTNITAVNIPSSVNYNAKVYTVTRIGDEAFRECTDLTSVTIPNSVTEIGIYAFAGCSGLTSVTIPNSVTSIGFGAFLGCSGLTSLTIPNSVAFTGYDTFGGCTGLTSVTLPNGITVIESGLFCGCTGLTSINIPNSVTRIERKAFAGCTGLTSVTIPNGVTNIGMSAFSDCTGLTSIDIPNSVTSIGDNAFGGCTGLTSITIPNSVTSIGSYAFSQCTGLTSITIPNSVTSIGNQVFSLCTSLTAINVSPYNSFFCSVDGVLFDKFKTTLIEFPVGKKGAYSIPYYVTSIGYGAFSECTGLTSVTIPNSVKSIGKTAFAGCIGLPSITIPNSVKSIGYGAFTECTGLTSITCEALYPPTLEDMYGVNAFTGIDKSIPLYVIAGVMNLYKAADGWKDFTNIVPIAAQETQVTIPVIEPDVTSALIAWAIVSGAATYELVIRDASGNVVSTLTFNAQGQLINIAFNAPAQNNESQQTQSAGFAFTVTGLEPGTQYNYSIVAKNASGSTLKTETGTFTTKVLDALENMTVNSETSRKILRNGQVLIERDGRTFNASGMQVK